ncbi:hypothetical protein EYF80_050793 [Liparis tanakae]|uniref:Uncharacterized protein n=1 Tax=Liparis tanakae TaxID=230148 RepID=A0A4Z2FE45_9TELE|nr:hypothetical protein EYF80_050793 [Liparis tanakae]
MEVVEERISRRSSSSAGRCSSTSFSCQRVENTRLALPFPLDSFPFSFSFSFSSVFSGCLFSLFFASSIVAALENYPLANGN